MADARNNLRYIARSMAMGKCEKTEASQIPSVSSPMRSECLLFYFINCFIPAIFTASSP